MADFRQRAWLGKQFPTSFHLFRIHFAIVFITLISLIALSLNLPSQIPTTSHHHSSNVYVDSFEGLEGKLKFSGRILEQISLAKIYEAAAIDTGNVTLGEEFSKAIQEAQRVLSNPQIRKFRDLSKDRANSVIRKFSGLVQKASSMHINSMVYLSKLKSSLAEMEERLNATSHEATSLAQSVAESIPKPLHCLHVSLTSQWAEGIVNNSNEGLSQAPESRPNDCCHFCIVSDNVLAVSVVVSSAVSTSSAPAQLSFHIITDRVTFAAMQMWFALHPPGSAALEVLSLDSFTWLNVTNVPAMRQASDPKLSRFYSSVPDEEPRSTIKFHNPKYLSILNHLRFYLPQLFPGLDRMVFLDDDVVVQRDLLPLFAMDLYGNVNGAVETCGESFHRFHKYLNFSHPLVRSTLDAHGCGWAFGMNVFDLQLWRMHNLTQHYHFWQEQNWDRSLWQLGTLPAGLLTFSGYTFPLERSWHVLGLGYDSHVDEKLIQAGAVIHWNGNKKPWLKLAIAKYRKHWLKHVNFTDQTIQDCRVS